MISARHAPTVALLLAVALVPTIIHSYRGDTAADGLTTAAIAPTLAGVPSSPTQRKAAWVKNAFDSDDWIERIYRVGTERVTLFAARSYDAKRLYHHPELAVLRGSEPEAVGVRRAPERPDVPLHVVSLQRDGRRGVAVYTLIYDGIFVEHPIAIQLRTSTALLVTGRKPMTLVLASDFSGTPDAFESAPATRVLLAAISSFERQAPADSSSR